MVDRARAARYLESLDRLLLDWRELSLQCTAARLASERPFAQRACYILLASIQTTLDLANMAIAEKGLRRPDSYREAFDILEKNGLIRDRRTAAVLRELAGFRNVLVHHYIELDWRKVQRNIRNGLQALVRFRQDAARWAR